MNLQPTILKTIIAVALPLPLFYLIASFACENAIFCFVKKNEFILSLIIGQNAVHYWIQIFLLFLVIYVVWSVLQKER